MVFFPNATIYVANQISVKNSEGTKIKTYDFDNPLATFRADVQPNTLSELQVELYGIKSTNANTKKCFFDSNEDSMKVGNRAKVVDDNGETKIYHIQPMNRWRCHSEALLIPVENE